MLGKINLSGGMNINGIIEEYKVANGSSVNAGDFVTYVNNTTQGTDTAINPNNYTGEVISAVALNENKVFVAHKSNNGDLYGIICTISNSTITIGTDTQLSNDSYSGNSISITYLSENKVFITHTSTSNYILYGMICTITNSTINVETDIQLTSNGNTGIKISTTALNENKVFIAHQYGSDNGELYGIVCTINNNTITPGTDTLIDSYSYAGYRVSTVTLSENKIFIAYTRSNNYSELCGIICEIEQNTITKGTTTLLGVNLDGYSTIIQTIKLLENKIFIAYPSISGTILYGLVCTIDNTTITPGNQTQLSQIENSGLYISAVKTNKNTVIIAHSGESNNYLYILKCKIIEKAIIIYDDIKLSTTIYSGSITSITQLSENNVFIAHRDTDYSLSGICVNLEDLVKTLSNITEPILGISKHKGEAGNTISVYTPALN